MSVIRIFYAGVGSRETPKDVLEKQRKIAIYLAKLGLTLRSGAADGSDTAFEKGCISAEGTMEIWMPWKGFNGRSYFNYLPKDRHYEIAKTIHPIWDKLSRGPKALHSRNVGQILGDDVKTPVAFVLCWTKDGANSVKTVTSKTGGTGTAIKLASSLNIPVINMYHPEWLEQLKSVLSSLKAFKQSTSLQNLSV